MKSGSSEFVMHAFRTDLLSGWRQAEAELKKTVNNIYLEIEGIVRDSYLEGKGEVVRVHGEIETAVAGASVEPIGN